MSRHLGRDGCGDGRSGGCGGGRGDGTKETLRRKLDPSSPQNKPNQGMSTKALREKARKLRTQIANARSKGKDNKAAVAEEKRINNMIRQRTR